MLTFQPSQTSICQPLYGSFCGCGWSSPGETERGVQAPPHGLWFLAKSVTLCNFIVEYFQDYVIKIVYSDIHDMKLRKAVNPHIWELEIHFHRIASVLESKNKI